MQSWLITSDEDDRLQGITSDAQVIYMRGLRRYMDFSTGVAGEKGSTITHQSLKRLIEYIPEWGSNEKKRTFKDVSTHYIRARLAELERAGLIEKLPKENKFDHLLFFLPLASLGKDRLKKEPQRNRKGSGGYEPQGKKETSPEVAMLSEEKEIRNRGGEPQGEGKRNRNNTGNQVIPITDVIGICSTNQIPPDLESVRMYCEKEKLSIDPVKFWNSYQSKGWVVGKVKMKDWQAAARYWASTSWNTSPGKPANGNYRLTTEDIYADF